MGILLGAGVLLAGCASSGTLAASGSHGPSTSASSTSASGAAGGSSGGATSTDTGTGPSSDVTTDPASAATSAGSTAKTGTQLKALFPGNAGLPAGFTRTEQSALDSGDTNPGKNGDPDFASQSCDELPLTAAASLMIGLQVSDAKIQLDQPDGHGDTIDLEATGYDPGDAAKQYAAAKSWVAGCPKQFSSKTTLGDPTTMTLTVTPITGLGDEAFEYTLKPSTKGIGVFGTDIVFARVGDVLLGADDISTRDGVTPLSLKDLVTNMARKLRAG
jgi:hypothetical protein